MKDDATFLMSRGEFRRFLFTAIQTAGIFDAANGHDGRDLNWIEGRRSLGFELLRMADEGQPEQLRTPNALATLNAVILENINSPKKEKVRGDRYEEV
jgi:hypothetical protein